MRRGLPGWLRWTSAVGFVATLFSLGISAYPFVAVVNARVYALKILGTILVSNLIALAFYARRRRSATAEEPLSEAA